jgi:hypothetical protein
VEAAFDGDKGTWLRSATRANKRKAASQGAINEADDDEADEAGVSRPPPTVQDTSATHMMQSDSAEEGAGMDIGPEVPPEFYHERYEAEEEAAHMMGNSGGLDNDSAASTPATARDGKRHGDAEWAAEGETSPAQDGPTKRLADAPLQGPEAKLAKVRCPRRASNDGREENKPSPTERAIEELGSGLRRGPRDGAERLAALRERVRRRLNGDAADGAGEVGCTRGDDSKEGAATGGAACVDGGGRSSTGERRCQTGEPAAKAARVASTSCHPCALHHRQAPQSPVGRRVSNLPHHPEQRHEEQREGWRAHHRTDPDDRGACKRRKVGMGKERDKGEGEGPDVCKDGEQGLPGGSRRASASERTRTKSLSPSRRASSSSDRRAVGANQRHPYRACGGREEEREAKKLRASKGEERGVDEGLDGQPAIERTNDAEYAMGSKA